MKVLAFQTITGLLILLTALIAICLIINQMRIKRILLKILGSVETMKTQDRELIQSNVTLQGQVAQLIVMLAGLAQAVTDANGRLQADYEARLTASNQKLTDLQAAYDALVAQNAGNESIDLQPQLDQIQKLIDAENAVKQNLTDNPPVTIPIPDVPSAPDSPVTSTPQNSGEETGSDEETGNVANEESSS